MYVGGSVWALDWCPTFNHKPDTDVKTEVLLVTNPCNLNYYYEIRYNVQITRL